MPLVNELPLNIRPASYSKAQTSDQVAAHIKAYPSQKSNTDLAGEHCLEFVVDNGPKCVASLFELSEAHPEAEDFLIRCVNNGLVHVTLVNGNFYVEEII